MKSLRLGPLRLALWAAAAATLVVTTGAIVLREYMPPLTPQVVSSGEANIRSKFNLTDHNGRAVDEGDFAGRWQLVFFGFTHCPDICPTTLIYMASVTNLLGEKAERVVPIFITVDPDRDTVPVLAEYISAFHPRLIGLTGSKEQVAAAAKEFKVYFERHEDASAPDGYSMAHAGHIYLMRPDGSFEAVFQEGDRAPKQLADEILRRIEKNWRLG